MVSTKNKKIDEGEQVIYPGFFDPFTLGHLNIVERSQKAFGKMIVSVAKDSPKQSLFSAEERLTMVRDACSHLPGVHVELFSGLLIHYVERKHCKIIIRGIRTLSDFEYEFQMALANHELNETIETIFMMTDSKYSFLSSTLIREIGRLKGNIDNMVPANVAGMLKGKYGT